MHLLKSHALRAKPDKDPRLVKADAKYQEWLKTQGGIRHPAVLMKARPLQGSIDYRGLPVSVETGKSRVRQWFDSHNQTQGMSRMPLPYGYAKGTMATDGDQLDIIVGPDQQAPEVYVVHINKAPLFERYDEDKCFVGLRSPEEAMRYFRMMYDKPQFFGSMSVWQFDDFMEAAYGRLKGKKLENGITYIPPEEPANGFRGPARLFTEAELREWAHRGDDLRKSGEAICKQIGDAMGIDWKEIDLDNFCNGMFYEDDQGGSLADKAKRVVSNLRKDPSHYSQLLKSQPDIEVTLRDAIAAEYDAIKLYTQMAESIDNELARKILLSVIDEEKVHAGEFLRVLELLAPEEARQYARGAQEVEDQLTEAGTGKPAEKE